jgi:WD40 repeat protein
MTARMTNVTLACLLGVSALMAQESKSELSPLDELARSAIPTPARDSLPSEVVAVLGTLAGRHSDTAKCVAVSPNQKKVASGSRDGTVRIWDATTLAQLRAFPHPDDVDLVAFSPDSKFLYTVCWDGNLRIWDAAKDEHQEPKITLLSQHQSSSAFNGDHSIMVCSDWSDELDEPILKVFKIENNLLRPLHKDLSGFAGAFSGPSPDALTLSHDGRWVAVGYSNADGDVLVWDLQDDGSRPAITLPVDGRNHSIQFSPDNRFVLVGGESNVSVWQLSAEAIGLDDRVDLSPKKVANLIGHKPRGNIVAIEFSPDAKQVFTGSYDHQILVWDWHKSEIENASEKSLTPIMKLTEHKGWVSGICFSQDGQTMYSSAWDHTVRRWIRTEDGFEPVVLEGHANALSAIAFSSDGMLIATGATCDIGRHVPNEVRLWKMGREKAVPFKVLHGCEGWINDLCFSDDGKLLAAACDIGICYWDLSSPSEDGSLEPRFIKEVFKDLRGGDYFGEAKSVAFVPNSRMLVSGWSEPRLVLTDLTMSPPSRLDAMETTFHHVDSVDTSSDGKLVAISGALLTIQDGKIAEISRQEGGKRDPPKEVPGFKRYSPNLPPFTSVAFLRESKFLAGAGKGFVRLFGDLPITDLKLQLAIPVESAYGKIASGNDGMIAYGDSDGVILLYDLKIVKLVKHWRFGRNWSLQFAPDGRHLAVGDGSGVVFLLRTGN